uniref:Uncharacterized protein n=1 Tax=Solanum lycopersicum TaxID=4081 RepID=A0A3Q7J3J5_SOLLC
MVLNQLTISDKGCDDDNVLLSVLPKLGIEDSLTHILAWQIPGSERHDELDYLVSNEDNE